MARNETVKMAEALQSAFNNQDLLKGTGSLSFVRADRRGSATIYLTKGKVEAIEAAGFPNYLLQRITSLELLSPENLQRVNSRFAAQPNSPLVADFMRELMMIDEGELVKLIKEHFLGVLDEILTWTVSKWDWKSEDTVLELTMPLVSPTELLKVAIHRQEYLKQTADIYAVSTAQLAEVTFRKLRDAELETPEPQGTVDINQRTIQLILSVGGGEYTILDLLSKFGIPLFKSTQLLKQLWLAETVDLSFKEFPILHPETQPAPAREGAAPAEAPSTVVSAPNAPEPVVFAQPTPEEDEAEAEEMEMPVAAAAEPETVQPAASVPFEDDEADEATPGIPEEYQDENGDGVIESPFVENAVDEAILDTAHPNGDADPEETPNQVSFEQYADEEILGIAAPEHPSDDDEVEGAVSPTVAAAVAIAQEESTEAQPFTFDPRNPLASIRAYIQTLRESVDNAEQDIASSDSEEDRVLQVIHDHEEYLTQLRDDRAARIAERDRLKREHADLIDSLKQL